MKLRKPAPDLMTIITDTVRLVPESDSRPRVDEVLTVSSQQDQDGHTFRSQVSRSFEPNALLGVPR